MSESTKTSLKELSNQELENFGYNLGVEASKILDKACEEANKLFNPYGMQVKVQVMVEKIEQDSKGARS